jgi:hypothetical protein
LVVTSEVSPAKSHEDHKKPIVSHTNWRDARRNLVIAVPLRIFKWLSDQQFELAVNALLILSGIGLVL